MAGRVAGLGNHLRWILVIDDRAITMLSYPARSICGMRLLSIVSSFEICSPTLVLASCRRSMAPSIGIGGFGDSFLIF